MAPKDDLKKGSAELMVLAVIEDAPRHGYDIARSIDDRSGGVLRFHVASLYPMLYRLERRGWITANLDRAAPLGSLDQGKFNRLRRPRPNINGRLCKVREIIVLRCGY